MGALNKVIEQVAYKQVEDMIVYLELLSEQIIKTSQDAQKNKIAFAAPATSTGDMNKKLLESRAIILKLQGDYKNLQDGYDKLIKKVDAYTVAKKNNTTAITNNSISQSQLLKNVKEEEVLTSSLTTYIQKLSVERIRASRTVADYNAMIQMGTALTEEQTAELAQATAQFTKYDNAIKAGKKSIGDSREYVGQYERANIGLSNSVAQIARELPSATFGFQTFALAISNNIPIAVDEINKAVAANKELAGSGKEITPVWKQITSALFSFNTAMSIGLLLVALYGKEIANWAKGLFGANEALELLNKNQTDFNNAKVQGKKDAQSEILELKKYVSVYNEQIKASKDVTKTDEQREEASVKAKIALDKTLSLYPGYIKSSKDLVTQNGKYSESIKKVIKDLEIQKDVEKKTAANVSNKQKIIDLEKELAITLKIEAQQKKALDLEDAKPKINDRAAAQAQRNTQLKLEDNYNSTLQKRIEIENNLTKYNKAANDNDKIIYDLKGKMILLEYSETNAKDENTKSIKLNTKAREDYLASEYELLHLRLTNMKNANKDILDDEASGYDLRAEAAAQYYQNLLDLANMEAKEELRVLKFATDEKLRTTANEFINQKEQLDNWLKDGKISQEKYNEGLRDAEEQLQYDRTGVIDDATNKQNIIYENQAQKLIEANKATVGQLAKIWDEINFGKADVQIGNIDLTNIQQLGEILKSIGEDATIEEIQGRLQEVAQMAKDNADDINKREAQLALDRAVRAKERLEQEIRINGEANNLTKDQIEEQLNNNKALQDADQAIIDAKKRVTQADNAATQTQIDNQLKLLEATKRVDEEIYQGKLELYNSIKDLANQLFENQISDYDNQIEKSNAYYDELIANAEDGSEQQQALEEQKQAKEEQLQKRKVELQRRQAIFNKLLSVADIGIKLAETIAKIQLEAAILRANPLTAALSAVALAQIPIAVATSAAQVGVVLATPLPKYEKGRKGGKAEDALINEKRLEPVESTDGTVTMYSGKNRIVPLKAGDIVHKSVSDFANSKTAL